MISSADRQSEFSDCKHLDRLYRNLIVLGLKVQDRRADGIFNMPHTLGTEMDLFRNVREVWVPDVLIGK